MSCDLKSNLNRYYEAMEKRPHHRRTPVAEKLNVTGFNTAVDCGCGTGNDTAFLAELGYQVYSFDHSIEAVSRCKKRFSNNPLIKVAHSTFGDYDYPACGLFIANASLFFAGPDTFDATWTRITNSIVPEGVFSGDFMGMDDDWANSLSMTTLPLTKTQVQNLFSEFNIVSLDTRSEPGTTALGNAKYWHTYSVIAVKK